MRTAIRKHLADFLAVLALIVLGAGVAAYILSNQRLRFPLVEEKPFVLKMELAERPGRAARPGPDDPRRGRGDRQDRRRRARGRRGGRRDAARAALRGLRARGRHRAAAHEDRA